jgi:hypothetical protein
MLTTVQLSDWISSISATQHVSGDQSFPFQRRKQRECSSWRIKGGSQIWTTGGRPGTIVAIMMYIKLSQSYQYKLTFSRSVDSEDVSIGVVVAWRIAVPRDVLNSPGGFQGFLEHRKADFCNLEDIYAHPRVKTSVVQKWLKLIRRPIVCVSSC